MNRIERIREAEKEYHDQCYEQHTLFEKGSWLYKPVNSVLESYEMLDQKEGAQILDLGAGVGRNSIPLAQRLKGEGGKVVCVDLLDSALNKLKQYSLEYGVEKEVVPVKAAIEDFEIESESFDFIVAVSSLEHVQSEVAFDHILAKMAQGTKEKGINCIIVSSEVEEISLTTNEALEPMMEVNIKTDEMIEKLHKIYTGWEVIKSEVKSLTFEISRNDHNVMLKTNAITFVIRKESLQ